VTRNFTTAIWSTRSRVISRLRGTIIAASVFSTWGAGLSGPWNAPTITEPHDISVDFVGRFPEFDVVSQNICAIRDDHDVYASLSDNVSLENPDDEGIVSLHLRKRG